MIFRRFVHAALFVMTVGLAICFFLLAMSIGGVRLIDPIFATASQWYMFAVGVLTMAAFAAFSNWR